MFSLFPPICQVTISSGTVICGFGKGRFRQSKDGVPLADNEVELLIDKPDQQLAIMDGSAKSIGEFMELVRAKTPDKPVLCYHESTLDLVERTWQVKQALLGETYHSFFSAD